MTEAKEIAEWWADQGRSILNADTYDLRTVDDQLESVSKAYLALLEENVSLRQDLDHATGPHCSSCGNSIDPDVCHCGDAVKSHGAGDGHAPVPMGCVCGYADPDWKALAKSRGEFAWKQCREVERLTRNNEIAQTLEIKRVNLISSLSDRCAIALAERDAYRAMLCDVIASASPNKRDHPAMSKQWERATTLLKDGPASCAGEPHTCEQEAIAAAEGKTDRLIIELDRMRPVFELAQRWCNRPLSVLKAGSTVLANDAEMFAKLHDAIAAAALASERKS